MTDLTTIITQLEQQKSAIEKALSALREVAGVGVTGGAAPAKRRGRPKKSAPAVKKRASGMTAEGRRRVSEAQKARWAAKKAASASKPAVKKRAVKKTVE